MVKQAHLLQLAKGVKYWNQWRDDYPNIKPSLNGANLRGWNFVGINLKDADLKGANLKRANLQDANLNWANLQNADLREANLRGVNLNQAFLEKAILIAANLRNAYLIGTDFKQSDLSKADLSETIASKANFRDAILTGVCLQDWHIDQFTNLNNVVCDYVYFRENFQERRPNHSPNNFAVGEFTNLFKKALLFQNQSINQFFDYSAQLPSLQLQIEKI